MTKKEMITVEAIKTSLGRKFTHDSWKAEFPKAYACYDGGLCNKIKEVAKENGYSLEAEKVLVKKGWTETKTVRLSTKDLLEILNDIGYYEDWDCSFHYIYLEEDNVEFKHDEKGFYKVVTKEHYPKYEWNYWFEKA